MKFRRYKSFWNLWPPFLGLGIKIQNIAKDFKQIDVVLKKRPWNVNFLGSQYGGGIFAMTDGIHMYMLVHHLPTNFRVLDKSAEINYIKKGETKLKAHFEITDADIEHIKKIVNEKGECTWSVIVEIKDLSNIVIAAVRRDIFIKDRNRT